MNYGGSGTYPDGGPVAIDGVSGATKYTSCPIVSPDALSINYDLYFNNTTANVTEGAPCSAVHGAFEVNKVVADPRLDVNYVPASGSPACGAGEGGIDVGARPCGGSFPPLPPPSPPPPSSPPSPTPALSPAISGSNSPPSVFTGSDQSGYYTKTFNLSGTATDSDGTIASLNWTVLSPGCTLTQGSTLLPSKTAS